MARVGGSSCRSAGSATRGAVPGSGPAGLYSDSVTVLAVTLALLSAATFAFSTSVQHQAAEKAPELSLIHI